MNELNELKIYRTRLANELVVELKIMGNKDQGSQLHFHWLVGWAESLESRVPAPRTGLCCPLVSTAITAAPLGRGGGGAPGGHREGLAQSSPCLGTPTQIQTFTDPQRRGRGA